MPRAAFIAALEDHPEDRGLRYQMVSGNTPNWVVDSIVMYGMMEYNRVVSSTSVMLCYMQVLQCSVVE